MEEVIKFTHEYAEVLQRYPWGRVLNMDETPWNFVFLRGEVLAIKGREEVHAELPDDYRKSFTAISTISADGGRFPPLFLAMGKTERCHQQFQDMQSPIGSYEVYHSPGGNTNEDVMELYFALVKKWMKGQKTAILMDRYASHVSQTTIENAAKHNIRLVFIPTSGTERFQPLDRRVFGALKSMGFSCFSDIVWNIDRGLTKAAAADLFVICWEKMPSNLITSAWNDTDDLDEYDDELHEYSWSDSSFDHSCRDDDEEEECVTPSHKPSTTASPAPPYSTRDSAIQKQSTSTKSKAKPLAYAAPAPCSTRNSSAPKPNMDAFCPNPNQPSQSPLHQTFPPSRSTKTTNRIYMKKQITITTKRNIFRTTTPNCKKKPCSRSQNGDIPIDEKNYQNCNEKIIVERSSLDIGESGGEIKPKNDDKTTSKGMSIDTSTTCKEIFVNLTTNDTENVDHFFHHHFKDEDSIHELEQHLQQNLDLLKHQHMSNGDSDVVVEQFQTIQEMYPIIHQANDVVVQIYEHQIRLAIIRNDRITFKQVQSKLNDLYERGLGSHQNIEEMHCYYIINRCLIDHGIELYHFIPKIDESLIKRSMLQFALDIWKALLSKNLIATMKLCQNAPGLCGILLKEAIDELRFQALITMNHCLRPQASLSAYRDLLCFDNDEEVRSYLKHTGVMDSIMT
jgi:hypothetical protein